MEWEDTRRFPEARAEGLRAGLNFDNSAFRGRGVPTFRSRGVHALSDKEMDMFREVRSFHVSMVELCRLPIDAHKLLQPWRQSFRA